MDRLSILDELIDIREELIELREELGSALIKLLLVLELLTLAGVFEQTAPVTAGRCAGALATPLLP